MAHNENNLERALRMAADDPANRPDFYRALIEADVYVVGETQLAGAGLRRLSTGEKVSIQQWARSDGTAVTPFFTSLPALQRAIANEEKYVALSARSLFEMTKGATLVLNPESDYGKEFFPKEIEALLSTGVDRLPEQRVPGGHPNYSTGGHPKILHVIG